MLTSACRERRLSVSMPAKFRISLCFLLFAFVIFGACSAQAATCTKTATTGVLPKGDTDNPCDLEVTTGTVIVDSTSMPAAWANVNIYNGGTLCFVDEGKNLDFWASGILVENNGTLTNGVTNGDAKCATGAFGSNGGTLTFHLYGKDQCPDPTSRDTCHGAGIVCKSDAKTCGVDPLFWGSNSMASMNPTSCNKASSRGDGSHRLPGGIDDCFYDYAPLDYDDAVENGYVGYKVLAVTYGGSLNLYGQKGVSPVQYNLKTPNYSSGRSWGRLLGTVGGTGHKLVLDRQVFWQPGDQIVLTTTDYIPGHSELLTLTSVARNTDGTTTLLTDEALKYDHNGETYDLSMVPAGVGPDADPNVKCSNNQTRCIETRAAIGLLNRSIRIVSGCDEYGQDFPAPGKACDGKTDTDTSYYFGGHVVVRQGIKSFQMSGVELKQMGQGGRIMHYPIHFHMAREVPLNTYVTDSTVWDSMNRWITIHATQGVTLARNVGYLSIGHGFYLEDGTETSNVLTANLGVMARGAIANEQNPRKVPGILSHKHHNTEEDEVPFNTDADHPTVFWITNGWNYFGYNQAAGANSCGVCYWFVPAANSGMSRYQHWDYYSAEQEYHLNPNKSPDMTYAGTSPLLSFVGNSCSSAQSSFLTIGDTAACKMVTRGVPPEMAAVENPLTPDYPAQGVPFSKDADAYYPHVDGAGSRTATVCPFITQGGKQVSACSTGNLAVTPCDYNEDTHSANPNCTVTELDRYTTSFNWADTNLSAVWLRKQWYLFANSAVTDVQNGGLTFVSGGGYTRSDEIPGYWALAHKSVFVGNTQKIQDTGFPLNPYASNAGPFNPKTFHDDQFQCQHPQDGFCVSASEGIIFTVNALSMNQRLFNIYDGPSYEQSNAFMDIHKTVLTGCQPKVGFDDCRDSQHWGNATVGLPIDSKATTDKCYLPNAAIAWKQPNGFYYPPAFRSKNLYFDSSVDIRHFVVEPLFKPGTLDSDQDRAEERYCTVTGTITNHYGETNVGVMFSQYTDVDRQTELTDEDGSLTGLRGPMIGQFKMPTISVNKDNFFKVPIETAECSSDIFNNMPTGDPLNGNCAFNDKPGDSYALCGTANTSPYDYLTTVVFPQNVTGSGACPGGDDGAWSTHCGDQYCPGVPLYRLDLLKDETGPELIRMAGQHTGQRSTLTVNHGGYFLDTTISADVQDHFACKNFQDCPDCKPPVFCDKHACKNVFQKDQEYYVFFLYARPETADGPPPTKQDYKVYVGKDFKVTKDSIFGVRVDQGKNPPVVTSRGVIPWTVDDSSVASTGVLTIHVDMSAAKLPNFVNEMQETKATHCGPSAGIPALYDPKTGVFTNRDYCKWDGNACKCAYQGGNAECENACSNWAGKDINCPEAGCYGFGFQLPSEFVADNSGATLVKAEASCLKANDPNWNTPFDTNFTNPNTHECDYKGKTIPDNFCISGKRKLGTRTISLSQ